MSCLDNIVTFKDKCGDEPVSTSGYSLSKAPELSPLVLSDIANEKYVDGASLAQSVLELAILEVKNDFLGVLAGNAVMPNILNLPYTTSQFNIANPLSATPKERGLTLYKTNKAKGRLKKMTIKKVSVLPLVSVANANVLIYDDGLQYSYPVTLTANLINTIEINHVVKGAFARVLVDNTAIPMASSILTCFVGCSGTSPNECGYTKGYNGDGEISAKEGYGIGLEFMCECDYDLILCDLSRAYIGKLIYLKARSGLLEERLSTNRLNNWIIYGSDEAEKRKKEIDMEYVQTWNTLVDSLPNILKNYNSDCLVCNRTTIRTNI
jgi:hypothetical protein